MNSSTHAVRMTILARPFIGAAVPLAALVFAGCAGSRQYQAGAAYLHAQDYDRAVETLREAIKARPGNAEYLARLEEAETKSADLHVAAAQEHLRNRRLSDAWRELEIARDRVPTHPEVTKLSEPLKRDIARSEALAGQAEEALREGRWEEAHRLAGEALAIDAALPSAVAAERKAREALVSDRVAAARLAAQRGDLQALKAALEAASRLDPDHPVVQQLRRQAEPASAEHSSPATRPAGPPAAPSATLAEAQPVSGGGSGTLPPAAPGEASPARPVAPASSAGDAVSVAAKPQPALADHPPASGPVQEVKPLPEGRRAKPDRQKPPPPLPVQPIPPVPPAPPADPLPAPDAPLIIGLGESQGPAAPAPVRPVPSPVSRPAEAAFASPRPAPAPAAAGPDRPAIPVRPATENAEPGRIVPAPRYGPSDPGGQAFLHRAVISRKDKRYRDTVATVDDVRVRLRDTDADPLDADIDIFIGTTRIRRDDVRIGQPVTFRVAQGRTYRLVILSILDDRETISFGIQRVPDAP